MKSTFWHVERVTRGLHISSEPLGLPVQASEDVRRSDGLDLFRFMSQLPSQQRNSLFEPSVLFALSVGVRDESAYRCSTQITALICEQQMHCPQRKLFGKSVDSLFLLLDLLILLLNFVCRFLLANFNPFCEGLISCTFSTLVP